MTSLPTPPSLAEVMSVFHFTTEELALNRAGSLSAAQVSGSHRDAFGAAGLLLGILGLALVITFSRQGLVAKLIFGVICWGALAAFLITSRSELWAALRPRVATTEGAVEIGKIPGTVTQIVTIGSFRQPYGRGASIPAIFAPGQRFRVFYVAGTERLLSLEPIAAPAPGVGAASESGGAP